MPVPMVTENQLGEKFRTTLLQPVSFLLNVDDGWDTFWKATGEVEDGLVGPFDRCRLIWTRCATGAVKPGLSDPTRSNALSSMVEERD